MNRIKLNQIRLVTRVKHFEQTCYALTPPPPSPSLPRYPFPVKKITKNATQGEYWKAIRLQYVRAIAFHGMTLEEALRHLLTDSGFRLPGESQKVDRLVSSFAECYVADNRDNPSCPFIT